jgi:type I restriction enzyme, S subunit
MKYDRAIATKEDGSMGELPKGWEIVELDMVGQFESGGTPSKEKLNYWEGDIPFVTGADITNLYISSQNARTFLTKEGLDSGKTAICKPKTVLFVTRTRVGRVGIATEVMGASQDLSPYVCSSILFPEYLCHYLSSISDYLLANCRGSTILGLTRAFVKSLTIPLSPLPEQRRIVAKLDSLFARSRRAREELARVPGLCNRYKQAVLAAAFRGDLTADWREENSSTWSTVPLAELCLSINSNSKFKIFRA